ncbi:hypothetical protein CKM354_001266600 [Cercospora kikuchii]|uniref:Calcineurin-like phosphoesterase domain-containing protein n=1 Tax=Cercospora kikuchii TaxID=84275 RepID=A0A9P3FMF4_9PEZI|nr:uncharacterized protein CKM354_001266600 [Cercospora kikuchii]GIZ49637.1 hypothetical protein CKM354_001266600 [Cercospora kikuchii]
MGLIRDKHRYHVLTHDDASSEALGGEEHASRISTRWTSRWIYMIVALAAIVLCSILAWFVFSSFPQGRSYRPGPLKFTKEGTFQIAVFADLHFGENAWDQWGPQQDLNTERIMGDILDAESQQLCVLNGDLITGDNSYFHNSSEYIDRIVKPIVQRGLPFASAYGNHDSAFNLSREQIFEREHRYQESLTAKMVAGRDAGVSNYYLEAFPHDGGDIPSLLLWFFDSRGGFYYQERDDEGQPIGQPNWIDQTVVDWFIKTNEELGSRYNKTIPSLAFVHIPTNASAALQTEVGVDRHRQPGINDDYILSPQAQGWCPDGKQSCPYGGQDVPFMQTIASTPGLMALFSGHDHGDTWCYKWKGLIPGMTIKGSGVNLCFNQHSGYGGYGSWERGARQILVREEDLKSLTVETWIRLESGKVVGAVTLNSTYGEDMYPATPNTKSHCPTCDYTIISAMPGTEDVPS